MRMAKYYKLLVVTMLWMLGMSANAAIDGDNFIVIVDDASKVTMVKPDFSVIELKNGENKFADGELNNCAFYAANYGQKFHSVTLDGEPMQPNKMGMYQLSDRAKAGSTLKINADFPDENYTINFKYTRDAGAITRAAVGVGDDLTNFEDVEIVNNSISVKSGSTVYLFCVPQDDWVINSIVAPNGETLKWTKYPGNTEPNTNFTATCSGDLTIDAKKVGKIDVTFNITGNPEDIYVTYGDPSALSWNTVPDLKEGSKVVEMMDGYGVRLSGSGIKNVTFRKSADAELQTSTFSTYDQTWYAGEFIGGGEVNIVMESVKEEVNLTFTVESANEYTADVKIVDVTVNDAEINDFKSPLNIAKGSFVGFNVDAPEDVNYDVYYMGQIIYLDAEYGDIFYIKVDSDSEVKVVYDASSGIDGVSVSDAKATYYDLTGHRIDRANLSKGVYIRVLDGKASKILVK